MSFQKLNLKQIKNKNIEEKKVNKGPLFEVLYDGLDVVIKRPIGGHWEGYVFSELRDDYEGRKILSWITRGDFDETIKNIAIEMLDE